MRVKALKIIAYLTLAYFSYLMLLITLQYVPMRFDAAFLQLKETEIAQKHYQIAFFSHVYTSILVLLLGFTQFSKTIRQKFTKLHRGAGLSYVLLILLVAGPAGGIMAYHANGGFWSQLSFMLQAIFWVAFTLLAMHYAIKKNFVQHRNFMIRSYALTMSAISLRLFKGIIVSLLEWPPMDTYKLVSWLGWLINIAIAEVIIAYWLGKGWEG